jgi:O-antigen ligase
MMRREDGPALEGREDPFERGESGRAGWHMMLWLAGTIVVLPVRFFELPADIELVEVWGLIWLPIVWTYLIRRRKRISLAYGGPMFVILTGSLASTLAAPNQVHSFVVLLKECYLLLWCGTLTVAFATLNGRTRQRLVVLWAGIAVLHGLLIGVQFSSPGVWRLSSWLGGKQVLVEAYRPAGLFISEHAGDANAAALFQLIGFFPLVLARPSRLVGGLAGGVLLCSILATGSMATTLALLSGLFVSAVAGAVLVRRFGLGLVRLLPAVAVLGGLVYLVMALNPDLQEHFERIFIGRADRSEEGRLDLWRRGIGILVSRDTYLLGVGPENFRELDGRDKQLHDDMLAFVVERGVLGGLGLMLFAATALSKALQLVRLYAQSTRRSRLESVIFPAAMVSLGVVSLFHQIFHTRELWLLLAVQEAMLLRWRGDVLPDRGSVMRTASTG